MSRAEAPGRVRARLRTASGLALLLAMASTACRQDMHDQPRVKSLAESTFFANGSGARIPPAGTVARGQLRADREFETGRHADDSLLATLPAVEEARFHHDAKAYVLRGRDRFDVFCSPCHGKTGAGDGMVVRRGLKQPSSYHVDRLRQAPIGYLFDVMTNGFGVMPSYAPQISVEDRWAIAAYVRTLQLSQHFDPARLASEERARLDAPAAGEAEAGHAGAASGH